MPDIQLIGVRKSGTMDLLKWFVDSPDAVAENMVCSQLFVVSKTHSLYYCIVNVLWDKYGKNNSERR